MKKKKKKNILFSILPFIFRILEAISPRISGKLALYLFLHPPRFKRPDREIACYNKAKRSSILVEGKKVVVYEWGKGPIIWLIHGWAGRATQLSSFISPLVKAGFQVIGIDAPGHGDSEGNESSVFLFEASLQALHEKYGEAYAYIGHSLGGGVGFYAMKQGLRFKKYVSISAPSIPELILHEAFDKIGATGKSTAAMCSLIEEKVGAPFNEFTASYWINFAPDIPYLLIHDIDDKEAAIAHLYALKKGLSNVKSYETSGLGHVRILRDKTIINEVVAFISS